jgi:aerobic-type carbon monoxide dehydrogenase small subunit (CoxS/CutS family)
MPKPEEMVHMELSINGEDVAIFVKAGRRLLDFLRDDLHLTGTKEGCGEGECGSCTVLVDGISTLACLTAMEKAIGHSIITIEGVGTPEKLHPIQKAMVEAGGVQCGMCTPGMVMSAIDLLQHNPDPTRQEIVDGIAGNLCRCTGYKKIIHAIELAAVELESMQEQATV